MRIFIAGPMRGLHEFDFPAFHRTAAKLRAEGHEVFNPDRRATLPATKTRPRASTASASARPCATTSPGFASMPTPLRCCPAGQARRARKPSGPPRSPSGSR
jgi:hypothetical protein